jgi:putative PIN family toxin of toxin-antitoxin system
LGEKKQHLKKIVADTNVVISALLFEGTTAQLVVLWKQHKFVPLVSTATLSEIIKVLAYPKFALSADDIRSILEDDIMPYVETVKISRPVKGICGDAADDMFLACALSGEAEAIITGDAHLLVLKEFKGIQIMRPADFLRSLQL